MEDYIVIATAAGNQIRAMAATTAGLTEHMRQIHNTSPVVTAALGRLLCAGSMMGSMMKGARDILTLQVRGDGPLQSMTVTADSRARVKGYAAIPDVMLPPNAAGKLDVGGALGSGTLSVIRDLGLKEPYTGQVQLVSGEIAEDLTYYFASSEQTPSSVALGVLMNKDNTVKCAGGFLVQLMPDASEETIAALEQKIAETAPVTEMLNRGLAPEDILKQLLEGLEPEILEKTPTEYHCSCEKARVSKALISIGKKELQEMIEDGEPIEVKCHFCNTNYVFSIEELKLLLKRAS